MNSIKAALAALLTALATACATPPQSTNLRPATKAAEVELKSKLSYKRVAGPLSVKWEEGLVPGIYVAEKQNDLGTFFRGPGRCVWLHNSLQPERTTIRLGGIWIPHDPSSAPRLYTYPEESLRHVLNVDDYIAGTAGVMSGPNVAQNPLVAMSLEANKDVPEMNFEIADPAFVQAIKAGIRFKQ